jgi:hypothetical protein
MKETIQIEKWKLVVAIDETRNAYSKIKISAPERCGCLHCKNYIQAREYAYPRAARELLERLGIDCSKEAEIYHTIQRKSGMQLYGGFFHIIGEVLTQQSWIRALDNKFSLLTLLRRINNLESKLSCFFTKLICFKLLKAQKICYKALNKIEKQDEYYAVTDSFGYSINERNDLLENPFKGKNILQINFYTEIPWVINETFPGPFEE